MDLPTEIRFPTGYQPPWLSTGHGRAHEQRYQHAQANNMGVPSNEVGGYLLGLGISRGRIEPWIVICQMYCTALCPARAIFMNQNIALSRCPQDRRNIPMKRCDDDGGVIAGGVKITWSHFPLVRSHRMLSPERAPGYQIIAHTAALCPLPSLSVPPLSCSACWWRALSSPSRCLAPHCPRPDGTSSHKLSPCSPSLLVVWQNR